jgi:hypothetical protein
MNENAFYLVRVRESWLDEKSGKEKVAIKQKLVKAISVTDSEAKITKLYVGVTFDWAIIGSNLSKIDEIVE